MYAYVVCHLQLLLKNKIVLFINILKKEFAN